MLNYRNAVLALTGAAAITLGLWAVAGISLWWFCLPLTVYAGVVGYGSATISSSFFIKTSCSAATTQPLIALTFDDGPVSTTPFILDVLLKQDVGATFFCIGNRVVSHPEVVQRIDREGHIIGNHSFSHHLLFDLFSTRKFIAEIRVTDEAITAAIGKKPRLFRPPYGVTTPNLARAIKQTGHACIGWSVRSMDTVIKDEQKLLGNMLAAVQPGAVFLFHDSSSITANILNEFIVCVKAKGFTIVPLDQLLPILPYE